MPSPARSSRARLPARYAGIVMPLILSILMTLIAGLSAGFLGAWMGAWAWSWVVAFPTLLLVLPVVRRLVALVVEPPAGR